MRKTRKALSLCSPDPGDKEEKHEVIYQKVSAHVPLHPPGNRNLGVKRGQKKGQKKPLFQITRNSHMVLRVGVSMFSRLGGRLGSTLGFWLPCSWLGGSSGRGPNEVVNF